MRVLLVSNDPDRDPGIATVSAELGRRGVELATFRADRFPVEERLAVSLDGCACPSALLDGVKSVWMRHVDPGDALPEGLRPDIASAIVEQAKNAIDALLSASDVPCFDPPDALLVAPSKPRQLAIARSVGLKTPRTLLTNDTAALRAFASECPGGLISKMVESVRVHAVVDGAEVGGLTRAVADDDLSDEASLALCPMVFQERVHKVRDWRVTVVADRVFPAAVRAGQVLDWRSERSLIEGFERAELPRGMEQAVLAYCSRIGLQFAAFDFVEDAAGQLWFIEANTTAYFHFVERATAYPISATIADLLTGELAPRR